MASPVLRERPHREDNYVDGVLQTELVGAIPREGTGLGVYRWPIFGSGISHVVDYPHRWAVQSVCLHTISRRNSDRGGSRRLARALRAV